MRVCHASSRPECRLPERKPAASPSPALKGTLSPFLGERELGLRGGVERILQNLARFRASLRQFSVAIIVTQQEGRAMDWTRYQDQAGFAFEYPVGWRVETTREYPSCTVSSPDGLWFALIQPMPVWQGVTPADIINKGMFPKATLFPGAKVTQITPHGPKMVEATASYRCSSGAMGRAAMVCADYGQIVLLCAMGTPESAFAAAEAVLARIIRTQNQGTQQKPADAGLVVAVPAAAAVAATSGAAPSPPPQPAPPAPATPQPLCYVPFTDPQRGSFTLEVPQGWRVVGGLNHPGVGDRRVWFEATSPDGIFVMCDPEFPQALCHWWGWGKGGSFTQITGGGNLLNLKPGAEHAADCYLKMFGTRRLPGFTQVQRRPRPEIADLVRRGAEAQNLVGRKGKVEAVETVLHREHNGVTFTASLLTTSLFNGDYGVGVGFWTSMSFTYIAPSFLAAVAEEARTHIARSLQFTAAMTQIHQQDENRIYANAAVQNQAQRAWFQGQQALHRQQVAMGDAIINNYWSQQAANDQMVHGWEQTQAVYDRLSQERSNAMLGNQRLYNDATGTEIHAPAGANYYWQNPSTGQIFGTETNQPPDYQNSYTPLKKL